MLAVLTVNSLVDTVDAADGVMSLREAIVAANQAGGADAIDFDAALFANGPATIFLAQGELKVTDDLAINGPDANLLTVDAGGVDPTPHVKQSDGNRVFNIDDGTSALRAVSITGVTLTGADVSEYGGAIFCKENLTITASTLTDNDAAAAGGAIYSEGTLFVSNSTISGNTSFSYSGGGGITTRGNTTILQSTISGNSAGDSGGGVWHSGGTLTLTDCAITGNSTQIRTVFTSEGGGVWSDTNTIISRCTITGNSAGIYHNFYDNGGGFGGGVFASGPLTITESSIGGNTAVLGYRLGGYSGITEPFGGVGGGIYHRSGAATIARSNVSNNSAGWQGGGVVNYVGTLAITDSTISGNSSALNGGGVYSTNGNASRSTTSLTINNSTISGNTARDIGGGIITRGSSLTINSSTISGNSAGRGGGVDSDNITARVSYSTIAGNSATNDGGGMWSVGNLTMRLTIAAGNARGTAAEKNDLTGNVTASFSLFGVNTGATIINSGGIPTNLIGTAAAPIDPLLDPLADNGGPTKTRAPLPGSPVIDAGDPNAQVGLGLVTPFDQRGAPYARIFDGDGASGSRIDIGAVESQTLAPSADFNDDLFVDGGDFLAWQRGFGTLAPNAGHAAGDADYDRDVDANDLTEWMAAFGPVGGGVSALVSNASAASPSRSRDDAGRSTAAAVGALPPATIDAAMSVQEMLAAPATRRPFRARLRRAT